MALTKSKKKLIYVNGYMGYMLPFSEQFEVTEDIRKADCLMLTGGADILPTHYGEKPIEGTYHSPRRDAEELVDYRIAVERDIPIIGICRGAQLLCALAGGKLVQDCTGHGSGHPMETPDGTVYRMSSLHHQMMRPEGTDHVMLGWSQGISRHYHVDDGTGNPEEVYTDEIGKHIEPEIVYFAKNRGLAIQGHPEMMSRESPAVGYCNKLVKEFLL